MTWQETFYFVGTFVLCMVGLYMMDRFGITEWINDQFWLFRKIVADCIRKKLKS